MRESTTIEGDVQAEEYSLRKFQAYIENRGHSVYQGKVTEVRTRDIPVPDEYVKEFQPE